MFVFFMFTAFRNAVEDRNVSLMGDSTSLHEDVSLVSASSFWDQPAAASRLTLPDKHMVMSSPKTGSPERKSSARQFV